MIIPSHQHICGRGEQGGRCGKVAGCAVVVGWGNGLSNGGGIARSLSSSAGRWVRRWGHVDDGWVRKKETTMNLEDTWGEGRMMKSATSCAPLRSGGCPGEDRPTNEVR